MQAAFCCHIELDGMLAPKENLSSNAFIQSQALLYNLPGLKNGSFIQLLINAN